MCHVYCVRTQFPPRDDPLSYILSGVWMRSSSREAGLQSSQVSPPEAGQQVELPRRRAAHLQKSVTIATVTLTTSLLHAIRASAPFFLSSAVNFDVTLNELETVTIIISRPSAITVAMAT